MDYRNVATTKALIRAFVFIVGIAATFLLVYALMEFVVAQTPQFAIAFLLLVSVAVVTFTWRATLVGLRAASEHAVNVYYFLRGVRKPEAAAEFEALLGNYLAARATEKLLAQSEDGKKVVISDEGLEAASVGSRASASVLAAFLGRLTEDDVDLLVSYYERRYRLSPATTLAVIEAARIMVSR